MQFALRPLDVVAGIGVTVWILGMGLVLGLENPDLQFPGALMWAAGFVVAALAAASAYLGRDRSVEEDHVAQSVSTPWIG